MRKILWIGHYCNRTGLAKVSQSLLRFLAPKYEVTMVDVETKFDHGAQNLSGFKIMGAMDYKDHHAYRTIQQLNLDEFDIVFIINDVWGIHEYLTILKMKGYKGKIACYFPVDAAYHDKDWYRLFDSVDLPVTYTNFGYNEVMRVAPQLKTKLQIIPHGVDTNIFFKMDASKNDVRQALFGTDKYNDAVIFLNANRNQTRKRLDITIAAFGMFLKYNSDMPDSFLPKPYLYMHCGNRDLCFNINKLAERYECIENVIITNGNTKGIPELSDEQMNMLYNACDIGVNTSMGEGWGLVNVEHAVTGAPQIVPGHSACRELFSDICGTVKSPTPFNFDFIQTTGYIPDINSTALAMNCIYFREGIRQIQGEKLIEKFTANKYLWITIADTWDSLFTAL